MLINLIGVLRKVTKNGTLWLHLSALVYFPNYLFSSLPYINFYCFQRSLHLQESRHCSTLLHFTHPWWSCQLNLAASRISITIDGNPARLFLALNAVSQEMLQPTFLGKSFEQVECKEKGRLRQGSFLFLMMFLISAFSPGQFSKCNMTCLSPEGLVSLTSHLLLSLLRLFRLSSKQLTSKGVHVSGNW